MGLLKFLTGSREPRLMRLPSGSFTVDANCKIMTSTLPQNFPEGRMREIGQQVLASFRAAKQAQMPLTELIIHFAALKLLARELRGGAMIFLMPQSLNQPTKLSERV
ncbi:MAG: hypothetical protein L0Y58_05370 [Verrucomicrobia subdivision 3 bacterium]|nr:hypothetical protein [Limisphaerales bacterium]